MSENFFVYQLYQQLRSVSLSDALTAFDDLREDSLTPEIADKYFGSFGVGDIPQGIHAPYERFICYREKSFWTATAQRPEPSPKASCKD